MIVPDDLAVIGVDELPAAAVALATLTAVRVDTRILADSILRKLDGRPAAKRPGSDIHSVIRRDSA